MLTGHYPEQKFNFAEVLANILTSVVMFGIAPGIPRNASLGEAAEAMAERDTEQALVSGVVTAGLEDKPLRLDNIAAQALGTMIGQGIVETGETVVKDIQASRALKAYNKAMAGSVNALQPGGNPARSRLGFFNSNSSNSNNNADPFSNSNTQNKKTDNNLLTESADQALGVSSDDNKDTLFDTAHTALGVGGTGAGVGEYSNVMNEEWKGLNGKWYSKFWGGNGGTGARSIAFETAEKFYTLGKYSFYLDTFINGAEIYDDYKQGNILAIAKPELNIIMGGVGAFGGPIGFGISTAYFGVEEVIDHWDSIESAIEEVQETDNINQEVTGTGIWGRPEF